MGRRRDRVESMAVCDGGDGASQWEGGREEWCDAREAESSPVGLDLDVSDVWRFAR